ncbi:MAG: hypothetical protein CVV24_05330, partial [Ignavibacteriae bacterium HGW-Ignavibacteriae-3]
NLIARSVVKTDSLIGADKQINLTLTTSQSLEILKPDIFKEFIDRGKIIIRDEGTAVSYTLISAEVKYGSSFSDGIFGGILIQREIVIRGNLTVSRTGFVPRPSEFTETALDTIELEDISSIENKSIPFTQAPIPSRPLLSTFWEPIIVVGTLIGSVILLFTVRSK